MYLFFFGLFRMTTFQSRTGRKRNGCAIVKSAGLPYPLTFIGSYFNGRDRLNVTIFAYAPGRPDFFTAGSSLKMQLNEHSRSNCPYLPYSARREKERERAKRAKRERNNWRRRPICRMTLQLFFNRALARSKKNHICIDVPMASV